MSRSDVSYGCEHVLVRICVACLSTVGGRTPNSPWPLGYVVTDISLMAVENPTLPRSLDPSGIRGI